MTQLCTSQPCEELFRTMRLFTTWGFMQINFTTKEALAILSKINVMLDIVNRLSKDGVKFADQALPLDSKFVPHFLPREVIVDIIKEAKAQADFDASSFGINSGECDVGKYMKHGDDLEAVLMSRTHDRATYSVPSWNLKRSTIENTPIVSLRNLHFADEVQEHSPKICRFSRLNNPSQSFISKQQFLSLINLEGTEKVTTDRKHRFIVAPRQNTPETSKVEDGVDVRTQITIGDWIVLENEEEDYLLGKLIQFKRKSSNDKRESTVYSRDTFEMDGQNHIGILLSPSFILETSSLKLEKASTVFRCSRYYKCTIDESLLDLQNSKMNDEFRDYIA